MRSQDLLVNHLPALPRIFIDQTIGWWRTQQFGAGFLSLALPSRALGGFLPTEKFFQGQELRKPPEEQDSWDSLDSHGVSLMNYMVVLL